MPISCSLAVAGPDAEADVVVGVGGGEQVHGEDAAVDVVRRRGRPSIVPRAPARIVGVARREPARQELLRRRAASCVGRRLRCVAGGSSAFSSRSSIDAFGEVCDCSRTSFAYWPFSAISSLVAALLDQSAAVEDQDAVGVAQRREPVGDGDRRAAAGERLERLLDRLLALGVDAAGGFVEDQDRRIVQDRPGDREPLPLAAGEAGAAFAEPGVVAERRVEDEVVRLGRLGRGDRLLRACWSAGRRRGCPRSCRGTGTAPAARRRRAGAAGWRPAAARRRRRPARGLRSRRRTGRADSRASSCRCRCGRRCRSSRPARSRSSTSRSTGWCRS